MFLQIRVNLPNGDMVGHTGDIEATVVACKAADEAVKVIDPLDNWTAFCVSFTAYIT